MQIKTLDEKKAFLLFYLFISRLFYLLEVKCRNLFKSVAVLLVLVDFACEFYIKVPFATFTIAKRKSPNDLDPVLMLLSTPQLAKGCF
jgi:hypothetical protein